MIAYAPYLLNSWLCFDSKCAHLETPTVWAVISLKCSVTGVMEKLEVSCKDRPVQLGREGQTLANQTATKPYTTEMCFLNVGQGLT